MMKEVFLMKTNKIAEVTNLDHRHVLRLIRKYRGELTADNENPNDYFIPSTYLSGGGQKQPAYDVTPAGIKILADHIRPDHANALLGYWERKGKSQWENAHPSPKDPIKQMALFSMEETPTQREKALIAENSYLKGKIAAYEKILSDQRAKAVNL